MVQPSGNPSELIEHTQYIAVYGDDLPEVRDWRWADG
jgi:phosphoketolase